MRIIRVSLVILALFLINARDILLFSAQQWDRTFLYCVFSTAQKMAVVPGTTSPWVTAIVFWLLPILGLAYCVWEEEAHSRERRI